MKVPVWIDKWIVFVLVVALGLDDLARSKGVSPSDYVLIPLMMAAFFLLIFLIWRACCRLAACMFGVNPLSPRVRVISNTVFFLALALMVLQPLIFPSLNHAKITFELPKKVSIH